MFEQARIVPHELIHDDPGSHKEPGLDYCVEADCTVPANCFGHHLEDGTPGAFKHTSVASQCDGYCNHEDGYVDHDIVLDEMPTEK